MVGEKILDAHGLGNGVLAYRNSLAASKVVLGDLGASLFIVRLKTTDKAEKPMWRDR